MDFECPDCGAPIMFPAPEKVAGRRQTEQVCPGCGQEWRGYFVRVGIVPKEAS